MPKGKTTRHLLIRVVLLDEFGMLFEAKILLRLFYRSVMATDIAFNATDCRSQRIVFLRTWKIVTDKKWLILSSPL